VFADIKGSTELMEDLDPEEARRIVERIKTAGLRFSSSGVGEPDHKINTRLGGKGVYFMEPDGHTWEILTASFARPRPIAE
jgi:hypothetical protein